MDRDPLRCKRLHMLICGRLTDYDMVDRHVSHPGCKRNVPDMRQHCSLVSAQAMPEATQTPRRQPPSPGVVLARVVDEAPIVDRLRSA